MIPLRSARQVILGLLGILLLPSAAAIAAPLPPGAAFVGQLTTTTNYNGGAPGGGGVNFDGTANVTWMLSPSDPDQINGTFTYSLYETNLAALPPIGPNLRVNLTPGAAYLPVPGRAGWVYFNVQQAASGGSNYSYNMTAWQAGVESASSCAFTLDYRGLVSDRLYAPNATGTAHEQCGSPAAGFPQIRPPPGVSAVVNQTATATTAGSIDFRWLLSPDDPNATVGNFSYRMFMFTTSYNVTAIGANLGYDAVGSNDGAGQRFYEQVTGGTAPFTAEFQVRAEDASGTHQWSNLSCVAVVASGNLYEANGCGLLSSPSVTGSLGGPYFPFLDVPSFAASVGLSVDGVGWLLGGLLIFTVALAAFADARFIGVVVGAALGFGAAVALGLIPIWFVIVVFLICAGIVVLSVRSSGGA